MSRSAVRRGPVLRASAVLTAALVTGAVAAGPAAAECHNVWQADIQGGITLVCSGDDGGSGSGGSSKPRPAPQPQVATSEQLAALRFRPSAAAVQRARRQLVAALATTGIPDYDTEIRTTIESGAPTDQIRSLMRRNHLSPTDLGDCYVFAYITGWQIVHDGRSIGDRVAQAVRRELRNRLAVDPRFRRMSDPQQQEYAERLAGWTSVLAANANVARDSGRAGLVEDAVFDAWARLSDDDLLGAYVQTAKLTKSGVSGDYGTFVP